MRTYLRLLYQCDLFLFLQNLNHSKSVSSSLLIINFGGFTFNEFSLNLWTLFSSVFSSNVLSKFNLHSVKSFFSIIYWCLLDISSLISSSSAILSSFYFSFSSFILFWNSSICASFFKCFKMLFHFLYFISLKQSMALICAIFNIRNLVLIFFIVTSKSATFCTFICNFKSVAVP